MAMISGSYLWSSTKNKRNYNYMKEITKTKKQQAKDALELNVMVRFCYFFV